MFSVAMFLLYFSAAMAINVINNNLFVFKCGMEVARRVLAIAACSGQDGQKY